MLSIIALICVVVGYLLFFFTENMIAFPIIAILAGFIISIVDLVLLYKEEKLQFGDFVKEAFHTSWGSAIAFIAGINFIWFVLF